MCDCELSLRRRDCGLSLRRAHSLSLSLSHSPSLPLSAGVIHLVDSVISFPSSLEDTLRDANLSDFHQLRTPTTRSRAHTAARTAWTRGCGTASGGHR